MFWWNGISWVCLNDKLDMLRLNLFAFESMDCHVFSQGINELDGYKLYT